MASNYRIYANIRGWELVDTKYSVDRMMKVVDHLIADEVNEFLVIEHNLDLDMDTPIIGSMRSYENFKDKQMVKRLGTNRT